MIMFIIIFDLIIRMNYIVTLIKYFYFLLDYLIFIYRIKYSYQSKIYISPVAYYIYILL
jgi:hypothetical protein